MSSKYDGSRPAICRTGGSYAVTIALTVGRGNAGVALPCKGCLVMARTGNAGRIRMNIGAAAGGVADLGLELPESAGAGSPFWVPISDVSQLYFSGTNDDVVDITRRLQADYDEAESDIHNLCKLLEVCVERNLDILIE